VFANEGNAPPEMENDVHLRALSLVADGRLVEVAGKPIGMHRMRACDGPVGWDPAVPLVGWAFPTFFDGDLAFLVTVRIDGGGVAMDASPETPLGRALATAVAIACHAPHRAVVRFVETGFGPDALWVDWQNDTFVMTDTGAVVSGPEFAGNARDAASPADRADD
jgi:hypothetical protein